MSDIRLPYAFFAGKGKKVHLGYRRRGDVVDLACGMCGVAFGDGRTWLHPTGKPIDCGTCLRVGADLAARVNA